jgi:hypothetical protein
MPFKSNWKTLGLKVALRKAIESGANELSWTTGEQQAERYDLSKQIKYLNYAQNKDGTYRVEAQIPHEGEVQDERLNIGDSIPSERLDDFVGKDVAEKIRKGGGMKLSRGSSYEPEGLRWNSLSGVDLKVGGEGMKGFYDKELVNLANDLAKNWGVRVGKSEITINDRGELKPGYDVEFVPSVPRDPRHSTYSITLNGKPVETGLMGNAIETAMQKYRQPLTETVHSLPITDAMRRDITAKGQALFMPHGNAKIAAPSPNAKARLTPVAQPERKRKKKRKFPIRETVATE